MQIQIGERNQILGYAVLGGFVNGVEIETLPEEFEENFCVGRYVYEEGAIREVPDFILPESTDINSESPSLEERIADLEEAMAVLAFGGEI